MKKILIISLFICTSLFGKSFEIYEAIQLKYKFIKSNKFKGELYIDKKEKSILSKYYNVTKSDKLPFYDKSKKFYYKLDNGKMILEKLDNNGLKKKFVYNLSNLDPDIIEMIGIFKPDLPKRSIIFNDDESPDMTVKKMPVLSAEALVVALATETLSTNDAFYLYEPVKNILIQSEFKKIGSKKVTIKNKSIDTNVYQLKALGNKKKLMNIYLTSKNTPVKIESTRKKWSFELDSLGSKEKIVKNYLPIIEKKAKNNVMQKLNANIIDDKKYKFSSGKHIFTFSTHLNQPEYNQGDYISNKYFVKKGFSEESMALTDLSDMIIYVENINGYKYLDGLTFEKKVEKQITISELEKKFAKKNENCRNAPVLICDEEEYELSSGEMEDLLKELHKKDIDIDDDDSRIIQYSYFTNIEYTVDKLKYLVKKKFNLSQLDSSKISFDEDKEVFFVNLDSNKINQTICKKLASKISGTKAKYSQKTNECRVSNIKVSIKDKSIFPEVLNSIYKESPGLKWRNVKIEKLGDHKLFYYDLVNDKGIM